MSRLWLGVMQDEVLIAGFGRSGHAKGDIPGVRFKVRAVRVCPVWDSAGWLWLFGGVRVCALSAPAVPAQLSIVLRRPSFVSPVIRC
jgi:hypothetical protein